MVYSIKNNIKNTFKSAVLVKKNKIEIKRLFLPEPKEGQVLIKNHFAGVCHTQLLEYEGKRGKDKYLPHCFGHEAVSTVEKIGKDVKKIKVGQSVVASWLKGDGLNTFGGYYEDNKGKKINYGPISVFSEYSIVSENRLYKLPKKIPLEDATFLGCAVPTGMGSIINYVRNNKIKICIIGSGGIGTFASLAAYFIKCKDVTVVDINKNKLKLPKQLNQKTLLIDKDNSEKNFYKKFQNHFDLVVECTGNVSVMSKSINLVRPLNGKLVINGNAPFNQKISFKPIQFNMGKSVIGSWGGNSNLEKDLLFFAKKISKLKFKLSNNISKFYNINSINEAFSDLKKGKVIRPIIKF